MYEENKGMLYWLVYGAEHVAMFALGMFLFYYVLKGLTFIGSLLINVLNSWLL